MLSFSVCRRAPACSKRAPRAAPRVVILLCLLTPPMAFATGTVTDETVLVTATREPYHVEEAPFAVEVYTRADIERSGAANFYDFLASQTSLSVVSNFGNPSQRLIDMRGYGMENGYQSVVVSVDGHRLNDIDQQAQFLGAVTLASIERVEIVKGAGGVTSGEGALAGTINIVTREHSGGELRVAGGNRGQRTADFAFGHAGERFSVSMDGSHSGLGAQGAADDIGQHDRTRVDAFALRSRLRPTDWLEVRAGLNQYDSLGVFRRAIPRDLINDQPTVNFGNKRYNRLDLDSLRGSVGATVIASQRLRFEADYSSEDKTSQLRDQFALNPRDYAYRSTRLAAFWTDGALSLTGGYERLEGERVAAATDYSPASRVARNSEAGFLRGSYRLGGTVLSAGVREETVDFHYADATGGSLGRGERLHSWELGASRPVSARMQVFASYARAVAAPDIDRFFAPTYDPSTFDFAGQTFNGFIAPVRADTVNLGSRFKMDDAWLSTTLFYSRLHDEIYADPVTGTSTNLDRSHKLGFEANLVYRVGERVSGRLGYTWTRARVDREAALPDLGVAAIHDRELPGVPRHGVNASIDVRLDARVTLSANQVYRSSAVAVGDFQNAGLSQRPYRMTNLALRYRATEHWTAYLAVDNVFETHNALYVQTPFSITPTVYGGYAYPSDYTRLWRFGVETRF